MRSQDPCRSDPDPERSAAAPWWSRPERWFLLVAVPFGLAFALLTPPGQFADEAHNFRRAYQVSTGVWLGEKWQNEQGRWLAGGVLPRSVVELSRATRHIPFHPEQKIRAEEIRALFDVPLAPDVTERVNFWNTALYSPVPYASQALGIAVGRLFDASPVSLMLLARLFGLAFCIGVSFAAIRTTPFAAWGFTVLALFPQALFYMASPAADGVVGALSRLWLALALRWAFTAGGPIRGTVLAALAALGALVALCKQVYVLLPAAIFLLPADRLGGRRGWLLKSAGVYCAVLLPWAAWSFLATSISVPPVPKPEVDPTEQLALVLGDPFGFAALVGRFAIVRLPQILVETTNSLGWLDVPLPGWIVPTTLAAIAVALVLDRSGEIRFTPLQRLGALGIVLGTVVGAALALYLFWTPPGAPTVYGFMGRYLYPVAPLLLVVAANPPVPASWSPFWNRMVERVAPFLPVVLAVVFVAGNATAVARLIERYY
ncbi:MAG: DUF2142 domain-containing protein [Proteobacteria bacterium]|nr:DUF2142 domain-containing protein [Pseudomonadota bacterium]